MCVIGVDGIVGLCCGPHRIILNWGTPDRCDTGEKPEAESHWGTPFGIKTNGGCWKVLGKKPLDDGVRVSGGVLGMFAGIVCSVTCCVREVVLALL